MAKYLEIKAVVFVPGFMDEATQEKIRSEGAEVRVVDGDYDDSIAKAREEAEGKGAMLVMDVSWEGYEEIPQVRDYPTSYATQITIYQTLHGFDQNGRLTGSSG